MAVDHDQVISMSGQGPVHPWKHKDPQPVCCSHAHVPLTLPDSSVRAIPLFSSCSDSTILIVVI